MEKYLVEESMETKIKKFCMKQECTNWPLIYQPSISRVENVTLSIRLTQTGFYIQKEFVFPSVQEYIF
jgi:hypothetical protein